MSWISHHSTKRHGRRPFAAAALTAASLLGCGGGSPSSPPPPQDPLVVAKAGASGDAQTGTVATALAAPLRVAVTRGGQPVAGVTVSWSTSGTGAAATPSSSVTDAQGIASTAWTLAQTSGPKSATASVSGATGSPLTFVATATAAAPASLALLDGNNQSATVGSRLGSAIRARIADQFDNPVNGATVTWTVVSGGGSMASGSSASGATIDGIATNTWTLGQAIGAQTAQATVAGVGNSPITFSATATAVPIGTATIILSNFFFGPPVQNISVGTAVTWTWTATEGLPHNITSFGATLFPSSANLTGDGQTYTVTFTAPGTYTYECSIHPILMKGIITVQ